jgi:hypothetical protein
MNPLDLIDKLITEHGSSAIQAKHLAMLKDEIAILLRKLDESSRENLDLKAKLADFAQKKPEGDQCPYCNQRTGKLVEMKPHPEHLLALTGLKIGYYQCSDPQCAKSYDKQFRPKSV